MRDFLLMLFIRLFSAFLIALTTAIIGRLFLGPLIKPVCIVAFIIGLFINPKDILDA